MRVRKATWTTKQVKKNNWTNKMNAISKEIDGFQFDSLEESGIYLALKGWVLDKKTGLKIFSWCELLSARPDSIYYITKEQKEEYNKTHEWTLKIRPRYYTPDFEIRLADWTECILEYKSKHTAKKTDYRLRMDLFLFLVGDKYNFIELVRDWKTYYTKTSFKPK